MSAPANSPTGVITTESSKPSQSSGDSIPTAAIVGAVLGGIILIATILGFFFCLRHRKHTKVYKAAEYPWPHVGSDMTPQLPGHQEPQTSRFAGLMGTKQKFAHQLDSREAISATGMAEATPQYILCAELPANDSNVRNI
ncbi:hypothetical protein E8E12_002601 [Didymella heteroderae]|uniref:Uncharacterized protein n=1 Tax=Didymella heteroderae TaxID=1769908 RepID=A0A9P4WZ74_9PLEO|nr:hypothetical protein E8E12_002601 [Didymella heteroderae]